MKSFDIGKNDAGQRVDRFIKKMAPRLPDSLLYKYLRIKRIKLNGKRCDGGDMLKTGDVMQLYINDEFFSDVRLEKPYLMAGKSLDVLYEDEFLMLINKPVGMLVHSGDEDEEDGGEERGLLKVLEKVLPHKNKEEPVPGEKAAPAPEIDTLINRVKHRLYLSGEYKPERENTFAPSLCNRIDRNTSGIVMAAKNAYALRILNEKIRLREVRKFYVAIVHGKMPAASDVISGYLTKDSDESIVKITDRPVAANSKPIKTRYRVIAENDKYSLLEIELLTGRTHQIRAHMASIGHPLLGDAKYGQNKKNKGSGFKHQALCAYKIKFEFHTPANELSYLEGKEYELDSVWFYDEFMEGKIK